MAKRFWHLSPETSYTPESGPHELIWYRMRIYLSRCLRHFSGNAQIDVYPLVQLKCMGPRAKRELRKELRFLWVKASRKR